MRDSASGHDGMRAIGDSDGAYMRLTSDIPHAVKHRGRYDRRGPSAARYDFFVVSESVNVCDC